MDSESVSFGKPGALDAKFGGGQGYVSVTSPAGGSNTFNAGNGIAIDSQGRILVAGESDDSGGVAHAYVCRLDTSGALDTSFGGSGCNNTSGTAGGGYYDIASAVTVDSSDRPTLAGESRDSGFTSEYMAVWRYTSGGGVDTSFGAGTGAYTSTSAAPSPIGRDYASGVTVAPSGEILTTGSSRGGSGIYFGLWAIDSAGGGPLSGFPQSDLPSGGGQNGGGRVIVHSSGNYVVAGYATPGVNGAMGLWIYATDGTLQGSANTDTQGWPSALGNTLVEDSSTTVVVVGTVIDTGPSPALYHLALWRWTLGIPATLTPPFGDGSGAGYIPITLSGNDSDQPAATAMDGAGRIVVAGYSLNTPGDTAKMVVWRFTSGGTLDTTWGNGTGYVAYPSATGATVSPRDQANALWIDGSGRYVVAGRSRDESGNWHIVVWRILP